jgi:two-component system cell cycle sensor histidine kinase/response regulator CckA
MSDLLQKLDAAERKIQELELKVGKLTEENNCLATLYSKLPVSYQSLNETGNIIRVNDAWLEHLGYDQNEIIGQHFSQFLSLESKELFQNQFSFFKKAGEVSDVEFDLIKKNGEKSSVLFSGQVGKDKSGNFQQTYCVFYDVSDLRKTEQLLRASHERLLLVLNSMNASVYVSTLDTHEILFMNRYMCEMFGNDKVGQPCWKVFRNESGPCEMCTNEQLVDSNGTPERVYVWHDKNPVIGKWFVNHDRAIEWIDGRLVKIQIALDISELKEAEEKLQQVRKLESVGTLAGGIAHDFNNLLGVILGNTELALDSVEKTNLAFENLHEIETATLRAKKLVDQLLGFSKKNALAQEKIDWATLIRGMTEFLETKTSAQIEMLIDVPVESLYVMGDKFQLQNVFKNIFINACNAIDSKGRVEVSLTSVHSDSLSWRPKDGELEGQWLQLLVKDNGVGMTSAVLDKVFDPYFTTQEFGKGAGLGLSITYGIVKSHCGHIMVKSKPNKGTSVAILLPQVDIEADNDKVSSSTNRAKHLLVVDDEPLISKMLSQMLTKMSYKVTALTSSVKALNTFANNPEEFDLILTDMAMPELNGLDLVKRIREINSDVPIIISTGNSANLDDLDIQSLHLAGFLKKPARKKELAELISKSLNA